MRVAVDSSRTTHGSIMCTDTCRYYTGLFLGIFEGATKDQLLNSKFLPKSLGNFFRYELPLITRNRFGVLDQQASMS
jgi:hypothetical protein